MAFISLFSFQILPDMTSVVAKWQSLTKKEKTDGEDKKSKKEANAAATTDGKSEAPGNHIEFDRVCEGKNQSHCQQRDLCVFLFV